MNKKEFDLWMQETKKSEYRWVFDSIMALNGRGLFWYRGGVDGLYIHAQNDGTVEIGRYRGAVPSITDAEFKIVHSNKVGDNMNDAAKYALERLGMVGLLAMVQTY